MGFKLILPLFALLLISGLAFGSNALSPHYQIYNVEGDIDADVTQATRDWARATPASFTFRSVTCEGIKEGRICIHIITDDEFASFGLDDNTLGITYTRPHTSGAEVWVRSSIPGFSRVVTIRHELGHAMGLHHSGPGTLMAPSLDTGSTTITIDDVAAFHQAHHNLRY
jgi:hypothetical protein